MERTNTSLARAIKQTRKELLDLLELTVGGSAQWPLIRTRFLNAFGRNGLEKFANELHGEERHGVDNEDQEEI